MRKLIILASVLFVISAALGTAQPVISTYEMNDKSNMTVLVNGDGVVNESISMSATAFASFKQTYPQLSMYARLFEPMNLPLQIENLDVSLNEFKNEINAGYLVKGQAVNKGDYWSIQVAGAGQPVTLSAQVGRMLVFTYVGTTTSSTRELVTSTITLPEGASNIAFNADTNELRYVLPVQAGAGIAFLIIGIALLAFGLLNQLFIFDRFFNKLLK